MRHTVKYYGTIVVLCLVLGVVPAFAAVALGASALQGLAVYIGCALVIIVPIDRKIDATWRATTRLKE